MAMVKTSRLREYANASYSLWSTICFLYKVKRELDRDRKREAFVALGEAQDQLELTRRQLEDELLGDELI